MRYRLVVLAAVLVAAGCTSNGVAGSSGANSRASPSASSSSAQVNTTRAPTPVAVGGLPQPDHIVVVVLENHSFDEITQGSGAPFIVSLVRSGAVFTQFYAITHPSEPNYLALFSGSTHGVTSDACPLTLSSGNLGRSLLDSGRTFVGYSEDLPSPGFTGCTSGNYARKHAPWTDFTNLPASVNQPMTSFPRHFAALPTVSFVIPNLVHDMHNGPLPQADLWLGQHLGPYVSWAGTHNSLLVLTADEDDNHSDNRIATIVVGEHVTPGRYPQRLTHYSMLRTIEDIYHLPRLGQSADAAPVTGVWS